MLRNPAANQLILSRIAKFAECFKRISPAVRRSRNRTTFSLKRFFLKKLSCLVQNPFATSLLPNKLINDVIASQLGQQHRLRPVRVRGLRGRRPRQPDRVRAGLREDPGELNVRLNAEPGHGWVVHLAQYLVL